MQKITTFLTYNNQAEEAANLYVSLFKNSKIGSISRYGEGAPLPKGTAMSVTFTLEGQDYYALNGGPSFKFSDGISLFVSCQTQEEIDTLWRELIEGGGSESRCGWLKDKFGVSWQIIPSTLGSMLGGKDPAASQRAMMAMLQMNKLDIALLQKAYDGK